MYIISNIMNNISNNILPQKKISNMHLEVSEVLITYVTNRGKARLMLHIGAGPSNNCQLTLNPIRPGGLRGPDGETHSCQSETSYPMMPKLGDF